MRRFYTEEVKKELVEVYCSGNYRTVKDAAACFGIPGPTLHMWLRERGIGRNGYTPPIFDEEVKPEAEEKSEGESEVCSAGDVQVRRDYGRSDMVDVPCVELTP
ncbi:MAG: transposase, partial [Spirochaetales bacterium]|nr:transposase [Spirochaetales bacterium]